MTAANVAKMYLGITLISVSKTIADTGIYAAILGFTYVCLINIYCVWLLLKARNRFKNDTIVDICDLTAKLYGEHTRKYLAFGLIFTNFAFLSAYALFFGQQIDQLVCKTFKSAECGHPHHYALAINVLLLPVIFIKKFKNVGIFSALVICFTFVSFAIIAYVSIRVLT